MARTLFDSTLDSNRKEIIDKQIAAALSATGNAIFEKIEILQSESSNKQIDNIAKNLRQAADKFTEEIIANADNLPRTQFVRCISLVSHMKIIANSLDESSPALHSVSTPGEPTSVKVIGMSPITRIERLGQVIQGAIRTFLRR